MVRSSVGKQSRMHDGGDMNIWVCDIMYVDGGNGDG